MHHFIINEAAGKGKPLSHIPEIEHFMESHGMDYKIWKTKKPMDAKYLAKKACNEKSSAVICVGGDGTIHETAAGMAYSGVPMGVLPAGSGNDFIHSLKVNKNTPLRQLLEAIYKGHTRNIDMIRMGSFSFINIGSIGLDAEIVNYAVGLKERFKSSAYLLSTIRNVFTYDNFYLNLNIDGVETDGQFTLIAVCNGLYYGGGFKIAPDAVIDDGKISLCVVRDLSKVAKATLFPSVLFGAHMGIKGVESILCKKVTINFEGTRLINLDGNIYRLDSPIEFEIMPWAAKVIVP